MIGAGWEGWVHGQMVESIKESEKTHERMNKETNYRTNGRWIACISSREADGVDERGMNQMHTWMNAGCKCAEHRRDRLGGASSLCTGCHGAAQQAASSTSQACQVLYCSLTCFQNPEPQQTHIAQLHLPIIDKVLLSRVRTVPSSQTYSQTLCRI